MSKDGTELSDTACKSSSVPGTAEAVVHIALPPSTEHPLQHPNAADAPLKITGEQTIRTAGELHRTFAEYLARGLSVAVDLSEVHVCDAAALQLLFALRQTVLQRKQRFHITAVSPAITETAAALGLRMEGLTTACGPAVANGNCEVGV